MPGVSSFGRRERFGVALMTFGIVIAYAWSGHVWVDVVDEGYFLDLSQRVAEGALPYRDFSTYYTPGIFYLFAAVFKLFGVQLLSIRYLMSLLRGVCALLMYVLARRVAPWQLAWLPVAIVAALDAWPIEPEPHPSWPAVIAGLLTVELVARHAESGRLRWLAAAGATAGVAYLFKQNVGAFTALGVAGYVMLRPHGSAALSRIARVAYVVGAATVVTALMREELDAGFAAALWLPLLVCLGGLALRAARDPAQKDSSLVAEALVSAAAFAGVTAAWLVPLLVALGPAQTPLALFAGDVDQASIASTLAPLTVGSKAALLLAICAIIIAARKWRSRWLALGLGLGLLILVLPTWEGPRGPVTNDPQLMPPTSWLDGQFGTLHLYLPTLAMWAAIPAMLVARGARGALLGYFLLFGSLASLVMYPRADVVHAIVASPMALVAGVGGLAVLARRLAGLPRAITLTVLVALPVAAVAPQVGWRAATLLSADDSSQRLNYANLGLERAPVLVPKRVADDLGGVVKYVQAGTPPGQPVFVYPVAPLVSFLADRPNPTRFDHFLPGTLTSTDFGEVIADLQRAAPRYVVWDAYGVQFWETDAANRTLSDYIWRCYQPDAGFQQYLVLERKPEGC
jgi:Dolichyl-phosphate-mannose-protein mannosyltransferase